MFKHKHKYINPSQPAAWKQIHKDIFVDGNIHTELITTCECGATGLAEAWINISIKKYY